MNVTQLQVRPHSLVAQVAEQLAELIRSQPPDGKRRLPAERRLAEHIGVSRQVVREAIKRLEHQGLLEVRQGSGIRIIDQLHRPVSHSLSLLIADPDQRLSQLMETRLAIEPTVASLAASRASAEQLEQLRELQLRLEAAPDLESAIEIDLQFHRLLAEASGNLMFRLFLDSLAEISLESRQRTIGRVGKETAVRQHKQIIDAIQRHDAIAAAQAMKAHLLAACRDSGIDLKDVTEQDVSEGDGGLSLTVSAESSCSPSRTSSGA